MVLIPYFGNDDWTGQRCLALIFPRLINLNKKKSAFVSKWLCGNQPNWKWKRVVIDQIEAADFIKLEGIIMGDHTMSGADTWRSKLSSDGSFYVHDLRYLINLKVTHLVQNPTVWISLVPTNVICFV